MLKFIIILLFIPHAMATQSVCNKYLAYENFDPSSSVVTNFQKFDQNLGPTRDQDSVGVCYAYTAADLLESWLKSHKQLSDNQHISAMGIGMLSQQEAWINNSNKFIELSTKQDQISKQIKEINLQIRDQEGQRNRVSQEENKLQKEFTQKHPRYQELIKLQKKLENAKKKNLGTISIENNIFYLEKSINQEVLKNQAFFLRSATFQTQLKEINQVIDKLKEKQNELTNTSISYDELIPYGGDTKEAIEAVWPKLCLESEISSRDEKLKEIFNQKKALLDKSIIKPVNIRDALAFLAVYQHSSEQSVCDDKNSSDLVNACFASTIAETIFPGFPFNDPSDLTTMIQQLKSNQSLFSEIINKSCKQKFFNLRPKIKTDYVDPVLPVPNNDSLFDMLDEALSNKKIAKISFKSIILDREDNFPAETPENKKMHTNHATLIVGSLSLCNEPYYILRNSWGKSSCKKQMDSFIPPTSKLPVNDKYFEKKASCYQHKSKESCDRQFKLERSREINHPFFCDNDGNFIISKKHLKKGLYDTLYISN